MGFVYLHVIWFVLWIKVEAFKDVFPYGLPRMIVSVEAIFLSRFVMYQPEPRRRETAGPGRPPWEMIQHAERQNQQAFGPLDATHDADDQDSHLHDGGASACEATDRVREMKRGGC